MISSIRIKLLICLLAFPYLISSAELEDGVYALNDSNFKDFLNENRAVFVKFYAPWCGHCKALAPAYSELGRELNTENKIKIAKVDCTTNPDTCKNNGIRGYPSLMIFDKGVRPSKFEGDRTKNGIINFIKSKLEPSIEIETTTELDKLINEIEEEKRIFVFFGSEGYESYLQLIKSEPTQQFYHIKNAEEYYKVNSGSLVSFGFNGHKQVLTSNFNQVNFSEFLKNELFMPVTHMNSVIYQKLLRDKISAIVFIYENNNKESTIKLARQFAKLINYEILVIIADKNSKVQEDVYLINIYRLEVNSTPFAAILETSDGRRKKFYYKKPEFNLDGLYDLFVDWKDKTISFDYLSEDIPAEQGDVYVLVAHTFHKIVNDPEKDVLVFFYSPSCGHCKNVVPTYEELARKYKNDKNILITKLNCKDNELEFIIGSFPTFYMYPAKGKDSVFYKGKERTVEAFSEFIEENRVLKGLNIKDDL